MAEGIFYDGANKKVVITSGHRCLKHNKYINGKKNSKHLIGASVDFYIKNVETKDILNLIFDFYKNKDDEYKTFLKNENGFWQNKEILIKEHLKNEKRNLDNNHNYSYVSINVLFDKKNNEKVVFSLDKTKCLKW